MVNHYRWDFIGLSTDQKPTPATSEKVVDGSTFYCSDNSKLYIYCGDQWYEKTGGGGSYQLPIATAETLGGVKIGDNLTINSETGVLSGNYSSFTGTDGEAAGTAGLVPAPATTDAGKFLKADGTWDTAGGGSLPAGFKVLTSDDYNNATTDPTYINTYKLDPGYYIISPNTNFMYYGPTAVSGNYSVIVLVSTKYDNNNQKFCLIFDNLNGVGKCTTSNGRFTSLYEDSLTSYETGFALSANQGRVLNTKIGDLSSLTTTDKSSIVAAINELASRL